MPAHPPSKSSSSHRRSSSSHHRRSSSHRRSQKPPKHQKIPKLPTHPLKHLGIKKNGSKMVQALDSAKTIYQPPKRLAFHSAVPEIQLDPFSYYVSKDTSQSVLSQFSKYYTSHLEVNFKHFIETEKDMGIKIDLNEYMKHKVFEDRETPLYGASSSSAHPVNINDMNQLDRELLTTDSTSEDFTTQRREMLNVQEPWLRRSKYMDYKDHTTDRRRVSRNTAPHITQQEEPLIKTQSELRADIRNSFNFKEPLEHPDKPGVTAQAVMDFVPNYELWGSEYAKVGFDTDILPSSTFEDGDEMDKQNMIMALGNRLYRGGILDKNLTKEVSQLGEELTYALPPKDTYIKEKPYEVDQEVEYTFVRNYVLKAIHNEKTQTEQMYTAASGKRHILNSYFLTMDNTGRAQYCKLANDVQLSKKAARNLGEMQAMEEKPQIFVRGRELTNAEREDMEKTKSILEPVS
eukprot:CAMPEP_0117445038 /NCGR_PEP_ID=MMETSP0759-20121206/5572_1 /TAXON_ID=63605 /ORGANISM="Percolomonas cosmopolitus, Strain WS" /LENGTH=460 /DNA_ID=CAMNT_0005237167 /DNA_START=73 /DNA_END=1452 /DNA_ORIENTATION=+